MGCVLNLAKIFALNVNLQKEPLIYLVNKCTIMNIRLAFYKSLWSSSCNYTLLYFVSLFSTCMQDGTTACDASKANTYSNARSYFCVHLSCNSKIMDVHISTWPKDSKYGTFFYQITIKIMQTFDSYTTK